MATPRATAVAPIGPVAVGSMLWRRRGELRLTAIVKVRFSLVHGAAMRIIGPVPLVENDVHEDGDPTHSLREASDLVPLRPRADVWLRGHAQFPGAPASVGLARLALYRGREAILDKTIHVVGDRGPDGTPQPFERVPLVYERAYGGIGHDDNPVGIGASGECQPNLLHPDDPLRSIGFGPISGYWRLRRGCLGGMSRRALDRRVVELSEGFDDDYFQAAPLDQRVDFLRGDEWLVLDGMARDRLRLQSRLPRIRGVARLMTSGDSFTMVADTLAIDADALVCTLVWRGSMALSGENHDGLVVAGSFIDLDQGEGDVVWDHASQALVAASAAPESFGGLSTSGTTVTEPGEADFGQTIVDRPDSLSRPEVDLSDEPVDGADATSPMRFPLAVDTEPGGPPVIDDDLPWVKEAAIEPEPVTERNPRLREQPDPRLSSLPPAPLDHEAYARALRQAGASEADIAALLRFLGSE